MNLNIRDKREALNISQEELSLKSGVSRPKLSELETGKATNVTVGTLKRIAKVLGCDIKDLFF